MWVLRVDIDFPVYERLSGRFFKINIQSLKAKDICGCSEWILIFLFMRDCLVGFFLNKYSRPNALYFLKAEYPSKPDFLLFGFNLKAAEDSNCNRHAIGFKTTCNRIQNGVQSDSKLRTRKLQSSFDLDLFHYTLQYIF